jgi:hypothetical protein
MLYHEKEDGEGTLAHDLPRALAQPNLRASFLISIREDALAKLDRFKGRIPTLFDNYLRVQHLDQQGARDAIAGPIDKYNELVEPDPPYRVETALTDTLLQELETGRVFVGIVGVGVSDANVPEGEAEKRIETPFLQLVMTRLWKEERRTGSRTLRLSTLERLGHSETVVKTHLDGTMKLLPRYARYVAARTFHHLVTPSGTKIAHTAADLAAYVGLATSDVEPVLDALADSEYRILRRVNTAQGDDAPTRFEIFHDVLAPAILDWRARYLRAREALQFVRRTATIFFNLAIGLGWIIFAIQTSRDHHSAPTAVFVVWGICAVGVWIRTLFVIARRSRRRTAWMIPFVGIVASALGPITALVALTLGAIRGWARLQRRIPHRARVDPASATHRHGPLVRRLLEDRMRTFSGLVAIVGAAVLLAACFLPLFREDPRHLASPDERLWLALVPLVVAFAIGALAVILLLRPPSRRWTSGLLGGLGIGALTFFVTYLGLGTQFYGGGELGGTGLGPWVGIVGAGLVLVAAAPSTALEIFAAIVGADSFVGEAASASDGGKALLTRRRARKRRQRTLVGFLAAAASVVGGLLVAAACLLPVESDSGFSESLYHISPSYTVEPFAGAVAAIVIGFVLMRTLDRRYAAGFVTGLGITSVTLFLGYAGFFLTDSYYTPRYGAYLGIAGGCLLTLAALAGRRAQASDAAVDSAAARAIPLDSGDPKVA